MTVAAPENVKVIDYEPKGGALELFHCRKPEVLLDGPAGTGKSRSVGEYFNALAERFPGCRLVALRKTRVSLSETWMVTFETKVLWPGHPCIASNNLRSHRDKYVYPNGSEVILAGMDNPTRLFSLEADAIYWNEANEGSENEWESLHRALRNGVVPWQQLIGDCNPDSEYHWLNQRCIAKKTHRILTRHTDNPSLSAEYLQRLSNLTGIRRKRLFLGIWCSAEGQIWENFDRAIHVPAWSLHTDGQDQPDIVKGVPAWRRWWLEKPKPLDSTSEPERIELLWFFAVVDWGHRNPGCLQVFGVDHDRNAYRIRELYCHRLDKDLWAEFADLMRRKFNVQTYICDAAEPANIDLFNQRMGEIGGDPIARAAVKQPKDFEPTASIVRERFSDPSLFLIAEANDAAMDDIIAARDSATDPERKAKLTTLAEKVEEMRRELRDDKKPTCTEDEIPSFVYRQHKDGQEIKEEPAPDSVDHGCDCLRYSMKFLDENDWSPYQPKQDHPPRSYGSILDHAAVRRKRFASQSEDYN